MASLRVDYHGTQMLKPQMHNVHQIRHFDAQHASGKITMHPHLPASLCFRLLQRPSLHIFSSNCRGSHTSLSISKGSSMCEKSIAGRRSLSAKVEAVVRGNEQGIAKEKFESMEIGPPEILHFYRIPLLADNATTELLKQVQMKISSEIVEIKTEQCFNVGLNSPLANDKFAVLKWLLRETYDPEKLVSKFIGYGKTRDWLHCIN